MVGTANTNSANIKKKLVRQLNFLMLMLNHPQGQTKMDIFGKIPEYRLEKPTQQEIISRDRSFNRDKSELAAAGFMIEVDSDNKYYIKRDEVFCDGLDFDEGQQRVLKLAAVLWRDGALKVAVQGALLKLDVIPQSSVSDAPATFGYADGKFFPVVEALLEQSAVSFRYQGTAAPEPAEFLVEIWGVIGRYGHWYLHAFDARKRTLKFFRLDRIIGEIRIEKNRAYVVPEDYLPHKYADTIRYPGEEKYCVVAGAEKYLAAVPLTKVSEKELRLFAAGLRAEEKPARHSSSASCDFEEREKLRRYLKNYPVVDSGHEVYRYTYEDRAAELIVPFLDSVEVLYPRRLQEKILGIAERSLEFQDQVNADDYVNDKHATQASKEHVPDILRIMGIAMLNANRTLSSYDDVLDHLEIDEEQLGSDLHTLNYIENLADAAIDFGYIDVDAILQEREFLGAAGGSRQGMLRMTRRQFLALIVSLQVLGSYAEDQDLDAINTLLERFVRLTGENRQAISRIYASTTSTVTDRKNVEYIKETMAEGKDLRLGYLDTAKFSYNNRLVKPLKVYSIDGAWYTHAWCHDRAETRIFRCDRMRDLLGVEPQSLPRSNSGSSGRLAVGHEKIVGGVGTFENVFSSEDGVHGVVVAVRDGDDRFIKDYFALRVKEYKGHSLVNKVVRVTIKNNDYFARFLLSSGGRLAILHPSEEAERCRHYALKIIELYGKRKK